MQITYTNSNEQLAADAFTSQSKIFDELYSTNKIVEYKRERVRNHLKKYIKPGDFILELNSGTGQDAKIIASSFQKLNAFDNFCEHTYAIVYKRPGDRYCETLMPFHSNLSSLFFLSILILLFHKTQCLVRDKIPRSRFHMAVMC